MCRLVCELKSSQLSATITNSKAHSSNSATTRVDLHPIFLFTNTCITDSPKGSFDRTSQLEPWSKLQDPQTADPAFPIIQTDNASLQCQHHSKPVTLFYKICLRFNLSVCSKYQVVVEEERPRRQTRGTAEILRCYPVPIHFQNATLLDSQYYFSAELPMSELRAPMPFCVGQWHIQSFTQSISQLVSQSMGLSVIDSVSWRISLWVS